MKIIIGICWNGSIYYQNGKPTLRTAHDMKAVIEYCRELVRRLDTHIA